MARIFGIDLPGEKRVDIGLTILFGVGRQNVMVILKEAQVTASTRIQDLTATQINRLQKVIEQYPVEGNLKQKITEDIKRLKSINCYCGIRHKMGLPVRGQRTRSNARTKRGKRKTVSAMKKEDAARTDQSPKHES